MYYVYVYIYIVMRTLRQLSTSRPRTWGIRLKADFIRVASHSPGNLATSTGLDTKIALPLNTLESDRVKSFARH